MTDSPAGIPTSWRARAAESTAAFVTSECGLRLALNQRDVLRQIVGNDALVCLLELMKPIPNDRTQFEDSRQPGSHPLGLVVAIALNCTGWIGVGGILA